MAKTAPAASPLLATQRVPRWAAAMRRVTERLTYDAPGPKLFKSAWVINFQKAGTFPFLLALVALYGDASPAAWIYVAVHGSYGVAWVMKDVVFPDAAWQRRVSLLGAVNQFAFVLGWYWVFGWLLISGASSPDYPLPQGPWFALCISVFAIGLTIMLAADAQKHFTLKHVRGLITTGMFARIRHPNYLGEMMVYGSFALLVWHWLPAVVLVWVWTSVFAVNMLHKEASMSRHPEWSAYRARTGWLLPKLARRT